MRTFLKTTQDATIYQRFPNLNTGLDEILEVGKLAQPTDGGNIFTQASVRFLVNFDLVSGSYPEDAQYFLNLYIANAQNVNRYQDLLVHPITSSWIEGSGYRYQNAVFISDRIDPSDPAKFINRLANSQDGATWLDSRKNTEWDNLGGDFDETRSNTYQFNDVPITDVKIDITTLISPINTGTISSWNGLLLKFPDIDEGDQTNIGNIKFFSGNTHTVFEPRLEIVWDDQQFVTGSLKPIPGSRIKITPKNLKQAYTRGEKDKIYLIVRDPFPDKRFDATQRFKNVYYLPSGSFFRITDEVSGVKIYDFDQFSAISCDPTGSYISLDTSGLDIDRFYKIELKVTTNDTVFFPQFEYTFKVDNDG
jgi:hypothetical protein